MSALKAAEAVLSQAGEPLRAEEMTRRILEGGLWHTKGKTPDATLSAQLAVDIKSRGIASRFQRTKRGLFALRAWGHPEYVTSVGGVPPISASDNRAVASHRTTLTFKDAAAVVLERYAGKKPMNYHDITEKALESGLIAPSSPHVAQTLLMEVVIDIARQTQRGQASRFTKPSKGLIGLSRWREG